MTVFLLCMYMCMCVAFPILPFFVGMGYHKGKFLEFSLKSWVLP